MLNERLYRRVFRWSDLPADSPRPGLVRRVYSTDQVMLVMNEVTPELELRPHSHEDFDQLVYIVEGEADYYVDGVPYRMGPGSLLLVPARAEHYIKPLSGTVLNLDIFVPPRADYLGLVSYPDGESKD